MAEFNPYELATTWVVFNPTPKQISARFNNFEINIMPFSKFETGYKNVHDHLINNINNMNLGLVSYTYTPEMQKVYPSEYEFQKAQAIKGLKNLESYFEQILYFEKAAGQANSIQKVPTFLKSKEKEFEKTLKETRTLITKYMEPKSESGTDQRESKEKA